MKKITKQQYKEMLKDIYYLLDTIYAIKYKYVIIKLSLVLNLW